MAHLAGEVRAELARRQRTATDLAAALDLNPAYLYKRLSGATPFEAVEIFAVAEELGVPANELFARAQAAHATRTDLRAVV